jgi:hypothetical protein
LGSPPEIEQFCSLIVRGLADRVLEAMLYAGHGSQQGARRKAEPDWACVHDDLRCTDVTVMLL